MKTTEMKATVFFDARANAFTGHGTRSHRFCVEPDGCIYVWDSISGHYTVCHQLGEHAQRRIRKLATQS